MRELPSNPHAIVEITSTTPDGSSNIRWDSWEHKRLFESIDVELVTNETSQAEWRVFDPEFKLIDQYAAAEPLPLASVRVFMGYGPDLGEPVFKGLLAAVVREDASTTFRALDMGLKMKLLKKAGYKNKKDDLAILRELTTRNGLRFEGPEKPLNLEPYRAMIQDEATDWEFVLERARDAGLVIFVRHDTLFAKRPAKVGSPKLTLKNRKDFQLLSGWDLEYRTPENQDSRPMEVQRRARGRGGRRLTGTSTKGARGRQSVVLKRDVPGRATRSKLTKRAQAQKELERECAFEGHIETTFPVTTKRVDVRDTIAIEGVGKLFSGKYICDAVNYRFEPGRLSIGMDLYRDIAE